MTEEFDPAAVTDLDARELLARGLEPLPVILALADALEPGRVLHIRSPFQPTPLYAVMAERGFAHRFARFDDDDWSSWFWREENPPPRAASATPGRLPAPEGVTDLRWLAPPEPLLWVLQWVSDHRDGTLRVMLPFFPIPLPDLVGSDGWTVELETERDDGVVVAVKRESEKARKRDS